MLKAKREALIELTIKLFNWPLLSFNLERLSTIYSRLKMFILINQICCLQLVDLSSIPCQMSLQTIEFIFFAYGILWNQFCFAFWDKFMEFNSIQEKHNIHVSSFKFNKNIWMMSCLIWDRERGSLLWHSISLSAV